MNKSSIYHISDHNFSYAISKDELNIRIKTQKNDVDKIYVYYKNLYDHSDFYFKKELKIILENDVSSLYECTIKVNERHFKYYFELHSADFMIYYTADGFLENVTESNCFYFPVINDDQIVNLPQWAEGSFIYQILVDRFFDGDKSNNPENVKEINVLPDNNTYYGGDFQGVIDKIDYIKDLGTDILYLSPLFESPTYHKYDVINYFKIEEIYGGKDKLQELIDVAHDKGIKVILDAVFNHCSIENELFQDVIKNGENSKYKDWFIVENFPVDLEKCNYDTFGGLVPSMPRFNTSNIQVVDYLCNVALYWTKELNIDGWRLDVADEVSHTFWQEFRRRLKSYKNDIIIIGEVWNHASNWLQGNEFDTVTNYKFRKWMLDFAKGDINSSTFWDKINSNKMLYKSSFNNYLINLLGSHDTIRYATYLDNQNSSLLAMVITLTMQGISLVYYGDEYGQTGEEDPDNRRAMQWNQTINNKYFETVKNVANFRKNSEALRKGKIEPININDKVIAFKRVFNNKTVVVIANFGEKNIEVNCNYGEILMGDASLTKKGIVVNKQQFVILGDK